MGFIVLSAILALGVGYASAADFTIPNQGLPDPGDSANDLPANLISTALNWFFVIAGIICIVVIIWAGITYATAGGDEEKVGKAKGRLIYGIIGIAVIIGSYAITQVIYQSINGGGNSLPAPPKL
ncbi:MAG: hypothetical protein PHT36_02785 [Patescibacteria group bacterium]|nr:hypothetical protein [Patescibacteria group bacterium]